MAHDLGQFAGDGAVEILDDVEVRGEEDIKETLLDLLCVVSLDLREMGCRGAYEWSRNWNGTSLVTGLHHRSIQPGNGIWESAEVASQESVSGEIGVEDIEELHEPSGNVLGQSVWNVTVLGNAPMQRPGEFGA